MKTNLLGTPVVIYVCRNEDCVCHTYAKCGLDLHELMGSKLG